MRSYDTIVGLCCGGNKYISIETMYFGYTQIFLWCSITSSISFVHFFPDLCRFLCISSKSAFTRFVVHCKGVLQFLFSSFQLLRTLQGSFSGSMRPWDWQSSNEVTLRDMSKIHQWQTITKLSQCELPNDAYSKLGQHCCGRLFGAKPLPEPMMAFC